MLTRTQIIINIASRHKHQWWTCIQIRVFAITKACLSGDLPHSTTGQWENPNPFFLRNNLNWWAFQSYLHGERWKDGQITKIILLFTNVAFFLFYISWNKLVYPFTNIFDISVFFFYSSKLCFLIYHLEDFAFASPFLG